MGSQINHIICGRCMMMIKPIAGAIFVLTLLIGPTPALALSNEGLDDEGALNDEGALDDEGLLSDEGQPERNGLTYGEWSARWWQWIAAIPADENPLGANGQLNCSIGQSGSQSAPVFFLAGSGGINPPSPPVVRECTVPKNKPNFYPLLNIFAFNDPVDPPPAPFTLEEKRELLERLWSDVEDPVFGVNGGACNLFAEVDGRSIIREAIAIARTQSPTFRFEVIENSVFFGTPGTVDNESVSDGFWVMHQLPAGDHTLHFGGDLCDLSTNEPIPGFSQDVTYHLHVR